ncbi:MAG TPA: ASKHA domain-containing protein [Chloroflexota bacterium]|nr:ASKHA domain-containing protein [Chloroflexota bacterium]
MPSITFLPDGTTHAARAGESVLDVARRAGLFVETDCGGEGTCGKCALRVLGHAPQHTPIDERHLTAPQLEDGWRLSCQLAPHEGDAPLTVQLVHQLQSVKSGASGAPAAALPLRPRLRRVALQLAEPSLEDQRSDAARLVAALAQKGFHAQPTLAAARSLPTAARAAGGSVTATIAGGSVLGVEPGDTSRRCYGIAYDVGTTTIVGTLVDLATGAVLATAAMLNPQVTYGADVIARINRTVTDPDGPGRLRAAAADALFSIAGRLTAEAGVAAADVWEITAVGNTAMLHLALGLDPRHLAPAPFIPVTTDAVRGTIGELWPDGDPAVLRPEALCYLLPGVASFVGADAVAVALATELDKRERLTLAIDIGTNGEILLGSQDGIVACSAAAGPAFEGAHIRYGMRGTPGAIERVRLRDGRVEVDIIGGGPARGICGSGLVDAVSELLRAGLIGENGRFGCAPDDPYAHLLVSGAYGTEFVLAPGVDGAPPITLCQKDVREVQLAKGAIRAGIEVLLARAGATWRDLDQVILAGAFGSYLDPAAARTIGLIPPVPLHRVHAAGNAAGRGAALALASVDSRRRVEALARRITYVELSSDVAFNDAFMDAMCFSAPAPADGPAGR